MGNMMSANNSQDGCPLGSMHETEEQRAVIQFLDSEGEKPADIHRRMKRQYGDACVSLQQVYEWHRTFKSGVSVQTMR
jgi:hypothetical protein